MKNEIQLLALKCSKCSQPLPAAKNTVVLYCSGCGSAYELQQNDHPAPVALYFARYSKESTQTQCFWAFNATLGGAKREAKGGFLKSPKGLMSLFEARKGLRFYVATNRNDLSSDDPLGLQLTREQPELEFIHFQKELPPVGISELDARKIVDYLLITSEASQGDNLRSLQYELKLADPMLIALAL